MNTPQLKKLPAWQALETHYQKIRECAFAHIICR